MSMRLRLGPILLCSVMAAYRAVWLSLQLSGFNVSEVGYLLLADLPVIGVMGLLTFAEAVLPRGWRFLALLLSAVIVAFYAADVVAVLTLNARLQLADLRQFAGEWWLARSYVSTMSAVALAVAAACFFISPRINARAARALPGTALALILLPLAVSERAIPSHLHKYTGSVLLLGKEVWGSQRQPVARYGPGDFAAYRRDYDALFEAPFARTRRNIVLVIVESLSASDSHRTSGIRDALPRFDALSREGMLFRNFFANFEASEGGIVALTSGVPPLHFPTASTNTFGEYALQRSIVESFTRSGYHSEFLTSVPLQFISMDAYARSPLVGFNVAAGQHEVVRYKGAPRFAFESPADHLLYEELLSRLDMHDKASDAPALMVAVTASSHPPYVDPLGRADTAENAWAYVQDQLWWLYEELSARKFFDNGLLLITGDHRRMTPIHQAERDRFGESAKARVPLVIIGSGVPKDVVDDRLFQQSDLLRMLDRAIQPGKALSPFALWVERYVFVYGVASNASNLEVFDTSNQARQGYRLKMRGTDVEWLARMQNGLAVERAIHRQRAMQQAVRAARVTHTAVDFGRNLSPATQQQGVLFGLSTDLDPGRDPDDPDGTLKTFTATSLDVQNVLATAGDNPRQLTLTARGFLSVPQDGEYWFSAFADDESCLAIDKEVVLGCQRGLNEGLALLTAGLHRLDLRYADGGGGRSFTLKWLPPGAKTFSAIPDQLLIAPETD